MLISDLLSVPYNVKRLRDTELRDNLLIPKYLEFADTFAPIIVNNKMVIYDGHHRVIAFMYLGKKEIKAEIRDIEICTWM